MQSQCAHAGLSSALHAAWILTCGRAQERWWLPCEQRGAVVPWGGTWGLMVETWTPPAATHHQKTELQLWVEGQDHVRQNDSAAVQFYWKWKALTYIHPYSESPGWTPSLLFSCCISSQQHVPCPGCDVQFSSSPDHSQSLSMHGGSPWSVRDNVIQPMRHNCSAERCINSTKN